MSAGISAFRWSVDCNIRNGGAPDLHTHRHWELEESQVTLTTAAEAVSLIGIILHVQQCCLCSAAHNWTASRCVMHTVDLPDERLDGSAS